MNNWIEEFFTGYAAAFHHPDVQVLLARYYPQLPFLTAQGPLILEASALADNMQRLRQRYTELGIVDWTFQLKHSQSLGAGLQLAELLWRFIDTDGKLVYDCDTSYILSGNNAKEAKVLAIMAHNEGERMKQALEEKREG